MDATAISRGTCPVKGYAMAKKTNKRVFPRRIDQDGSYGRCRAKTWGIDPRRGNIKRKSKKDRLKNGDWDFE